MIYRPSRATKLSSLRCIPKRDGLIQQMGMSQKLDPSFFLPEIGNYHVFNHCDLYPKVTCSSDKKKNHIYHKRKHIPTEASTPKENIPY